MGRERRVRVSVRGWARFHCPTVVPRDPANGVLFRIRNPVSPDDPQHVQFPPSARAWGGAWDDSSRAPQVSGGLLRDAAMPKVREAPKIRRLLGGWWRRG